MFHVELRMGMHVVRRFNLSEPRLWLDVLTPLLTDREFSVEGHEFIPRQTRLKVYEGPELRADQLGMGRGWQNVERTAADVTERVLAQGREHLAGIGRGRPSPVPAAPAAGVADLLRERLIGRLSAGSVGGEEILATAVELMPTGGEAERAQAAAQASWELLARGVAELAPAGPAGGPARLS